MNPELTGASIRTNGDQQGVSRGLGLLRNKSKAYNGSVRSQLRDRESGSANPRGEARKAGRLDSSEERSQEARSDQGAWRNSERSRGEGGTSDAGGEETNLRFRKRRTNHAFLIVTECLSPTWMERTSIIRNHKSS